MFSVGESVIDLAALQAQVRTNACGAVVTFAGVVRDRSDDGRPVRGLTYEAHASMAVSEFETIAQEARERFGPSEIAAVHRTGHLNIGEIAVAVAVASAHRALAFDACEFVIDEIKARAPVWKKEEYTDGDTLWRENDRQSSTNSR